MADFWVFLTINSIILVLYAIPATYVYFTKREIIERQYKVNMLIYVTSFTWKTLTWLYMVLMFKETDTPNELFFHGRVLFILDYLAVYAIKASLLMFIFQMMHARTLMQSQNHDQNVRGQKKRLKFRKYMIAG